MLYSCVICKIFAKFKVIKIYFVLFQEFEGFTFIFRTSIHFELSFIYGVRKKSHFIFLLVPVQLFNIICCKYYFFPPSNKWVWDPCQKSFGHKCMASFLGSQVCFIGLCVYPYVWITAAFYEFFENRK